MFQRFFRSPIQENPIMTYQWLDDERIYHPSIADVAYIKSFLERTQNDVLITRREYSDLLIGNLKETSTNQEVIIHLISIMKHLIEISIIQFESAILPSLNVLHDYYGALICLSDYLNRHRKDDDPLDVMEIHILYIFVNCILSNTL
ncbi:hypothetical protein [Lysinibacillus capsici]|uniref:hypothetical protein n=1 Tax=Lysinibacillus capsici TaxID=2115968 RepID=UPI002DBB1EB2|nr:hypothetical protein [Lysinibacillus capsici]MEC1305482.1 hypothetical protein [Lysinibacillus capsici]